MNEAWSRIHSVAKLLSIHGLVKIDANSLLPQGSSRRDEGLPDGGSGKEPS